MSTTSNQGHFLRDLTVKLFSELSAQKNENFCISPLSISMAMSLAYSGARNKTAAQLKQFLNLNDLSNEEIFEINKNYLNNVIKLNKTGFKLFLVNKLYVKKGANLNPEFIDCLNSNYFTDPELIDFNLFETIIEMNDWIAVNTNNKVNNLIDYDVLNNYTKMLLANASYFKGKWLNQFNKDHTYFEDFYLNDGSTVKVEMMKLLNKKFLFKINPGGITAITCEIPYIGDSLVMTVILPHEGISLQQVESELTSDVLKQIMYFNKNMYIGKVNVYLPKFKIEYKNQLSECLSKLGASFAFDSLKSDFNGITQNKNDLYLSYLAHESIVEVDEDGSDDSLSTIAVQVRNETFVFELPNALKCNRPFLFFIHDKQTDDILYFGKYVKP